MYLLINTMSTICIDPCVCVCVCFCVSAFVHLCTIACYTFVWVIECWCKSLLLETRIIWKTLIVIILWHQCELLFREILSFPIKVAMTEPSHLLSWPVVGPGPSMWKQKAEVCGSSSWTSQDVSLDANWNKHFLHLPPEPHWWGSHPRPILLPCQVLQKWT